MSNAITEIDNTDLVFIFGYNPADSHPIVANHVINAKRNGAKIIVCDPRKIETARIADMHIALKNGSNIALLNAIGHVIIEEDLYDKSFVASRSEGFEEYRKIVEGYTPESVEAITGVSAQEIRACARMYASAKSAAILWGMGVTQFYQGVETVRSLTSLAILTGNLGKPSVGVNPVRGQNNVQGLRHGRAAGYLSGLPVRQIPGEPREVRQSLGRRQPAGTYRLSHQRAAASRGAR